MSHHLMDLNASKTWMHSFFYSYLAKKYRTPINLIDT